LSEIQLVSIFVRARGDYLTVTEAIALMMEDEIVEP